MSVVSGVANLLKRYSARSEDPRPNSAGGNKAGGPPENGPGIFKTEATQKMQTLKPETDRAKLIAAILDWLDVCERVPLAQGESSFVTVRVAHEPAGLAWSTARGYALREQQP
jgi:hypothetical protein